MDTVKAAQLRAIAKRIRDAADMYSAAADEMEASGIANLPVRGFATLVDATLPRVESPLGSLRRSLASEKMKTQADSDVADLEDQIKKGRTGRKKKE